MPTYNESVRLGGMIRERRRALGNNQVDLAGLMGVDQSAISRWERGQRPDEVHFERLAAFLGISIEDLVRLAYESVIGDPAKPATANLPSESEPEPAVRLSALNSDLEELRREDPEEYERIVADVRYRLRRVRARRR